MAITHLFASIPVSDLEVAVEWYERFAGRPADLIPNEIEAAWQLSDTGWVYVILDPQRAGSAFHTLLVDDLDTIISQIAARGITGSSIETFGAGVRRSRFEDPDGNRVAIGQPPGES